MATSSSHWPDAPAGLSRRALAGGAAAALLLPRGVLAQAPDAMAAAVRAGGCAVLIRHAQTVAGVGDPEGFRVDLCSTQRNLSDDGRNQARRIGQWFQARGFKPRAVQSSAWCRCKDTADLAFGRHVVWPALNSTFGNRDAQAGQTAQLRAALARIPPGQFEVWVTHQVNMTALTGEGMVMGEGLAVNAQGKMVARSTFG
ncbi:MAG: histidine phosphatase family protein [Proteobacteria bacterium]|jgi:phosphohistidine phosphatase SixA|nr:histidine phosphatase family protein [Ramlibacter sp.]MCA0213762.1 histidine phosphatase family protein [Pseudomonadota bacterium]